MNRLSVKSSQIHSIGYDPEKKVLEVAFHSHSDKPVSVYQYENVEPQQHAAFLGAKSVGSHFHQVIRGKFPHTKL